MELLGLAEIASMLGVTRQVIANWKVRKANFPKPAAELKAGPVWTKEVIKGWAEAEGLAIADEPLDPVADISPLRRAVIAALMNMKGGVGKSTMTANFGWFAAYYRNLRVLLVDLDPQFNLSQYILGVKGYEKLLEEQSPTIEAIFGNSRASKEVSSLTEVVREVANWDDGSCLHIVPANLELAWSIRYAIDRPLVLRDRLDELRSEYDLILLDCAPTESALSTAAYLASDNIFVPVRPEFLSTIGLPLLLRSLKEHRNKFANEPVPDIGGIIFNDTGEKSEHDRSRTFVRKVAKENGWYIFKNQVTHSDSYPAGARLGKPIFLTDNARAWKKEEFNKVAGEFLERVGL
jgi:chromosome partitioning protein